MKKTTIYIKRRYYFYLFIFFLFLTLGGLLIPGMPLLQSLATTIVGTVGTVLLAWTLISRPYITFGPKGLDQSFLWRKVHYDWKNVSDFTPIYARGRKIPNSVGFKINDGQRRPRLGFIDYAGKSDMVLPSCLEIPPIELAKILNESRTTWIDLQVVV